MSVPFASANPHCDVLVIGGGPAGSTLATFLAEKGWDVALIEKDHHPRFHIGESLLPLNLPLLERLGVLEEVRAIGVPKYGAEFAAPEDGEQRQTIYFANAIDKAHPYAFQVRRAEFDHILLKNSARRGVRVYEGVRVKDIVITADAPARVELRDAQNETHIWKARFVVDASGRDTLLGRKFDLKRKNTRHQSAAVFGHFENVTRHAGHDAGNISIHWFAHGWFWMIPLRDGAMSVGAVCWPEYLKTRHVSPAEFLWQTIKLCPPVFERMRNATLIDNRAHATGNYSYRCTRLYGDNWLLVGDAYTFIDPVFSTGVLFAMTGATLGADAVDAWLRDPALAKPYFQRLERKLSRGIKTVSWFIYRFTSPAMHTLFMNPRNSFRIEEAIISVLSGDVFRATPIGRPLLLFRGIYLLTFLADFGRSLTAWRRRRRNAGEQFSGGTTPLDVPEK